jgi:hypothetical protein
MLLNAGNYNLNFTDKKMELSKIISTSIAIGALAFAANSFAVPTHMFGQADTNAEYLNLTDLYAGGSADSFAVTNDLFTGLDAFGIYEFTNAGGIINLGATLEVLNSSSSSGLDIVTNLNVNKVNVTFDQNTGLATNDFSSVSAMIDSSFGLYAVFGGNTVYSHTYLNGGTDLVGIFNISSLSPDLNFLATFDNGVTETALKVFVNDTRISEPSIVALFGLGLVGMGVATRRKQKQA